MKFIQEQGGWPNKSHAGHFLITLSAKDRQYLCKLHSLHVAQRSYCSSSLSLNEIYDSAIY